MISVERARTIAEVVNTEWGKRVCTAADVHAVARGEKLTSQREAIELTIQQELEDDK